MGATQSLSSHMYLITYLLASFSLDYFLFSINFMASLNATMLRIAAFCLAQRGHHMENYGVRLLQGVK